MPPPRKRPRLHFIGSSSPEPDLELATARKRNDNLLKTRWESVFERYERDFTGVGDEIGIISGEVEVDNGHLRSMQNDKDIGQQAAESPSKFDGRRMLRAMTVVPTGNTSSILDADEILQSIETIADNALLSDYSSEDDLFDTQSGRGEEEEVEEEKKEEGPSFQDRHVQQHDHQDVANDSSDDLFDDRPIIRPPSIDSLFVPEPLDEAPAIAKQESPVPDPDAGVSVTPLSQGLDHGETTIREQVRRILQEEREQETRLKEERFEPAWRLPLQLPSRSYSRPASTGRPRIASTDHSPAEAEDDEDMDEDMSTSLWKTTGRPRRSRREVAAERNLKRIRAESEDPLQEGFTSESEESSRQSADGGPSQPSSRHATAEQQAELSPGRPSPRPSTQPPSPKPPATHGYGTRQALRRRPLEKPTSRPRSPLPNNEAISTTQHSSTRREVKPERVTSVEPLHYQWIGRSEGVHDPAFTTAPEVYDHDDVVHDGPSRRDLMLVSRGSSPVDLLTAAEGEAELEQPEDTIVVKQVPQPDGASNRQSTNRDVPRTPRACHPWEIQTSRPGQPATNPAKPSRRSAGQKYKVGSSKPSSATGPTVPDGNIPTTSVEMRKMDPVLAEIERRKILDPMRKGLCVYCKASYRDSSTTGMHWDRILTTFAAQALDDDDPHDIEFIHSIRSKIERRTRAPKTFLRDFRLVVELHEGGGLSFQQIAASKLLQSTKHSSLLEKEYATYRQISPASATNKWTEELEKKLWTAVEKADDNTTMTSVRRQLIGRNVQEMSMLDLGNKLADRFLKAHRSRNDAFGDQLQMYSGHPVQPSDVVEAGDRRVQDAVEPGGT